MPSTGCTVVFTYFKPSGKFYTEYTEKGVKGSAHEILAGIRAMHEEGTLPAVSSGGKSFHLVAEVDGVPTLMLNRALLEDSTRKRMKELATLIDARSAYLSPDHPEEQAAMRLVLELVRLVKSDGCTLCAKGFPKDKGVHYGTQALGMIPNSPCTTST